MSRRLRLHILTPLLLLGCAGPTSVTNDYEPVMPATTTPAPAAVAGAANSQQVAQGRYLVKLLGCGTCHTDGALVGRPRGDRLLAGSGVGIAWTNPVDDALPGIVFPANLTPDIKTGTGLLSERVLIRLIRTGSHYFDSQKLRVMPWQAYRGMSDGDARAIAVYLRSLPPVAHEVPAPVAAGTKSAQPYVHFGVYRSRK